MNTTMIGNSQHELHPDAEKLNAFAEQALGERERGQVLGHLAVCERCRQVVTLALESALNAEVVAQSAAPRRTGIHPNAWWRQWRIVWVPATVAVALAVTSISAYMRYAEQSRSTIKIAEETASQGTAPTSASSPQQQARPAPPAPAHSGPTPRTTRLTERPAPGPETPNAAPEPPEQEASASAPTASESVTVTVPSPGEETAPATGGMMRRRAVEEPAEQRSSAAYKAMRPTAQGEQEKLAEQQRQAEFSATQRRVFTAEAAAQASAHGVAGGAEENRSESFEASPELSAPPVAAPRPAAEAPSMTLINPDGTLRKLFLPSGLHVESIEAEGHRVLAIDTAGALFLSEDSGDTWERVAVQWTGRAVKVRRRTEISAMEAAPVAASPMPGSASAGTGAAPAHAIFFELLNDQNQVWLSTDGRIWIAK